MENPINTQMSQSYSPWSARQENVVIALFGGIPLSIGNNLRRLVYRSILAGLGSSVNIGTGVEFVKANGIDIGNGVKLYRDVRIRSLGINSKIYLRDNVILDRGVDIKTHQGGEIEIGEYTYIGPYTCLSGDLIKIGQDCLIASHTGIYANDHGFADPTRKMREQPSTYKGIVIEDDCWLGSGVRVLDGVTIGRGSVIGAGAVVTKNIPPYSIAVGVPAKVISQRNSRADGLEEAQAFSTVESKN